MNLISIFHVGRKNEKPPVSYEEKNEKLVAEYEETCGPLYSNSDPGVSWLKNPWPWDLGGNN